MKHQLLMLCNAGKLEELKENQYAAPIPENNEHTQGSASPAFSSFACFPESVLGGRADRVIWGFQLLFKGKQCSSVMGKHEIISIGPKGTHREMD